MTNAQRLPKIDRYERILAVSLGTMQILSLSIQQVDKLENVISHI